MLRRRTTAGDNFLTSYSQNYCYILNKLGTFKLKASARFIPHIKNLGLQKLQIAHCCKKFCCSRRKMFNSKTEQRINLKFLAKFKLWWKFTAKNACQEPAFLKGTKDFVKAGLMLKTMNVHDAQPYGKPLTISEKLKILSEKIVGLVFDWKQRGCPLTKKQCGQSWACTRYLKSSGAAAAAIWQKKQRRCRLSLFK